MGPSLHIAERRLGKGGGFSFAAPYAIITVIYMCVCIYLYIYIYIRGMEKTLCFKEEIKLCVIRGKNQQGDPYRKRVVSSQNIH